MWEERYFIPLYVSTYIGVTNKNLEPWTWTLRKGKSENLMEVKYYISLLKEQYFMDRIKQSVKYFLEINVNDDVSPTILWEAAKPQQERK